MPLGFWKHRHSGERQCLEHVVGKPLPSECWCFSSELMPAHWEQGTEGPDMVRGSAPGSYTNCSSRFLTAIHFSHWVGGGEGSVREEKIQIFVLCSGLTP